MLEPEVGLNKIFEYLIEFSGDLKSIKTQNLHTSKHLDTLQAQTLENNRQLNHQNELLAEHMRGTLSNTERLAEEREARLMAINEQTLRLAKLEEGPKFRVTLSKFIIQIAAVTTSAGVILSLLYKVLEKTTLQP